MLNVTDWLFPLATVKELAGCEVDPEGNPESVIVVVPVNPFTEATEIEMGGLVVPKVALTCAAERERVKSGAGDGAGEGEGGGRVGCDPPPPQLVSTTAAKMQTYARDSVTKFRSGEKKQEI